MHKDCGSTQMETVIKHFKWIFVYINGETTQMEIYKTQMEKSFAFYLHLKFINANKNGNA